MELALTEEHMNCVTGMGQRLRIFAYNHSRCIFFFFGKDFVATMAIMLYNNGSQT